MRNSILIIDDSPDDVALLKRAFGHAGVKNPLIVAEDGEKGLAHFQGDGPYPCVVLSDLRMPRIDGFEVIRTIASNPKFSSVLLVAMTHYDIQAINAAYKAGAQTSLLKPPNPVEIRNLMEFFSAHWVVQNPSSKCK